MQHSNIIIFSRNIQTGKTTELKEWLKGKSGVYGLLTPDIDGKRMLQDLNNNRFHAFENDDAISTISIGKYLFDNEVFEIGKSILINSLKQDVEWLIIDEIGALEIHQNKGWEPEFNTIIEEYKTFKEGRLLVVVRSSLLDAFVQKYNLINPIIITNLQNI